MKAWFLAFLAGVGVFIGVMLLLVPMTLGLVAWFHSPPPDAPHGGGLGLAGKIGLGIVCDISIAAVVGVLVYQRLDQKWFEPSPKPRA